MIGRKAKDLAPGGLLITLVEWAVLAAASYRATQLVVWDSIADPIRDRIHQWHAARPDSTLRNSVVTLISCVYCSGWWLSGVALTVYLLASGRWDDSHLLVHAVEWFAVAGGQALANRWDDTRKATT